MIQESIFDYIAKSERDEALKRVADNSGDWITDARLAVTKDVPMGWTGTAEDLRLLLTEGGLRAPHHHNAWGALINGCVPRLLRRTGQWRSMRTRKSHARQTPVYVRGAQSELFKPKEG